jgi:hypothetical protein
VLPKNTGALLYFVKIANSNFMTAEQITGVLMFEATLLKRKHTHTNAEQRLNSGTGHRQATKKSACLSQINSITMGQSRLLSGVCEGNYGTIQMVREGDSA